MDHCSLVGTLATRIAAAFDKNKQFLQDVFAAGILHDIGVLVLLVCLPEPYGEARALSRNKQLPLWEAERQVLGATHAEIGAYLMNLWGLPDPIVEAIAWHHQPSNCPDTEFSPLTAVHIANALLPRRPPFNPPHLPAELDIAYLSRLRLLDQLESWKELAGDLEVEMTATAST
jgi:HD-like signal output (HDOD) protein